MPTVTDLTRKKSLQDISNDLESLRKKVSGQSVKELPSHEHIGFMLELSITDLKRNIAFFNRTFDRLDELNAELDKLLPEKMRVRNDG